MRLFNKHLIGPCALLFVASFAGAAQVNLEWAKIFDGNVGQSYDIARKIGYDSFGNVYTGGSTSAVGGSSDFCIIKRTPAGAISYTKIIHVGDDSLVDMKVDAAGNVYATGSVLISNKEDAYTFKLDTAGNIAWAKTFVGQFGHSTGYSVVFDANSDVYVLAEENASNGLDDITLIKYAGSNGAPQWSRRKDGGANKADVPRVVQLDGGGNPLIGAAARNGENEWDFWTLKYNSAGDLQWEMKWDSAFHSHDLPITLKVGPSDKVCIGGTSSNGSSLDCMTVMYDQNGNLLWERRFDGYFGDDFLQDFIVDPAGNVYSCGTTAEDGPATDALVLKYGPTGNFLWKKIYKGPADEIDFAKSLALDSEQQLLVLIEEIGVGTQEDIAILKLNSANGSQTWRYAYNGPNNGEDSAIAIAAGAHGDFIVAGTQSSLASNRDIETLRFSQDPIGIPDSYTTWENVSLGPDSSNGVLKNDKYYGEGVGVAALVDNPIHGDITLFNDGGFLYDPDPNFVGTDTFTYRIIRNGKLSVATTVTIAIKNIVPSQLLVTPTVVFGGSATIAKAIITFSAPQGGLVLDVTSASSALIVPPTVTVPAGQDDVTFEVGTTNVATQVTRTFSVSRAGVTKTASVTIKPFPILTGLSIAPSTVTGGMETTGTVNLSLPAPAGGLTVDITDNSTALFTPTTVIVPQGAASANFLIGTAFVGSTATRTVTATFGGVTKTANVTLVPLALLGIQVNPSTVVGGSPTTGTVTLNGIAPAGGTTVTITPNSSVIVTPASVKVPAGQSSVSFEVTTKPVAAQAVRTITATYNGVSKMCALTLTPP